MSKQVKEILLSSYNKQTEATEKLREIYDFGLELTTEQRNELVEAINAQTKAALVIHQLLQATK